MTRFVYFLRPQGLNGPIKIGSSRNPVSRLRSIQAYSPFPLELIGQAEAESSLEWRLHARFRDQHSHNEWFHWSEELEETVARVCDGTLNVDTLPAPHAFVYGRRKLAA